MHPHTDELLAHLDRTRSELRTSLDAAPTALHERPPAADRWSIAQVLEHLGIVERQVAALLRRGVRAATANGPLPPDLDTTPVLPTIDGARLLDRERRVQAGPMVQPKAALTAAAAFAELERTRADVVALVQSVDGQRTDAVQAPHPVLGTLTFHQWIAFLGFHEARHAAQIRAVMHELLAR